MDKHKIATLTSIALIPPVVATAVISVLVLLKEHGGVFHQLIVWITAVLSAGGLQVAYVLYLKHMDQVSAWDVPEKEHRSQPYLISAGISAAGLLMLLFLNASVFIWGLLWCYTFNTLILYAINRHWKISAHMMGFAGPLVFLWPVLDTWLFAAVPLAALLGWARIETRAHSLSQVIAGAAAGVLLTLLQAWILLTLVLPAIR
jgi:membrane-associated phospholipid phosphatase